MNTKYSNIKNLIKTNLHCLLFSMVLVLSGSFFASAQNSIKFGVGPSMARMMWPPYDGLKGQSFNNLLILPSVQLGADIVKWNRILLSVNVGYLNKGGIDKIKGTNQGQKTVLLQELRYSYLSGDLRASYLLNQRRFLKNANIVFDPYWHIAFRVDKLISMNEFAREIDLNLRVNSWGNGLIFGGGAYFPINKLALGVEVNFHQNIVPLTRRQVYESEISNTVVIEKRISSIVLQPLLILRYRFKE